MPSFAGEERNIIDILTVNRSGRLVVYRDQGVADPDLAVSGAWTTGLPSNGTERPAIFKEKATSRGVHFEIEPAAAGFGCTFAGVS